MSRKLVQFVTGAFLLVISPGLAVAGELSILNNGAPLGGAKVSVQTLDGKPLATTRTNAKGIAKTDLPATAAGQPVVYRVEDGAGNVTEHVYAQPSGQPSELVAMDTKGGITGYDKGTYDHLVDAKKPLPVGANKDVGCGAKLKGKAKKAFGGLLSGVAGQALGGKSPLKLGGSGSGGGKEIKTKPDPIAKKDKRIFTDAATGTRIAVGTQFTPDGLQVSSNILNAPCDGSFQSVYLMDAQGNKAGPTRYDIYEMYQDWWLTVTWTYDRWSGNEHVEHKEGGWSDEGRNILGTFSVPRGNDGIWSQMGFSNGAEGIKGLGTFFPVSPNMFKSEPMTLVVHVVNADGTPVTTVPFVIGLASSIQNVSDKVSCPEDYKPEDMKGEATAGDVDSLVDATSLAQQEIDKLKARIVSLKRYIEHKKEYGYQTQCDFAFTYALIGDFANASEEADLARDELVEISRLKRELKELEERLKILEGDSVLPYLQPIIVLA